MYAFKQSFKIVVQLRKQPKLRSLEQSNDSNNMTSLTGMGYKERLIYKTDEVQEHGRIQMNQEKG